MKEKAAFRKRAMAVPVVEKKREAAGTSSSAPKKKKKSKLKRPKSQPVVVGMSCPASRVTLYICHTLSLSLLVATEGVDKIKQAVLVGPRSNMPYRVLKAVVDVMGRRYTARNYQSLTLEEILTELGLTDLRTDTRQWLAQVCVCVCVCVCVRENEL